MRSVDSRPDVGLADVDFGPGPVTMTALCGLDPDELVAAANAEAVGLWHELAAFCLARAARHAAALTDQHGGPSDPVAAFEAERAADLTAARAESDPLARAAGIALASGGDGTDPARAFPEWEKDVLAARLGISTGQAKRLCRTSVALRDRLPATARALSAGAISWAHADRLAEHTRDLDGDQCARVERQVLADRRVVTPRQVENRTRKLSSRYLPAPDPTEMAPPRSLIAAQNTAGGVDIEVRLDAEGGRTVATALDSLSGRTGPVDDRLVEERRADALVELCTWWLERGAATPTGGGNRPHLTLTTTLPVLAGTSTETVTLGGAGGLGPAEIDARAARRLACDALVHGLSHDRGQILDLGRSTRVPTAALRRRLDARDGGCRFPTCTRPAARCHAHHVQHWAAGGETSPANMLLLCHRHHRAVHDGGWTLHFDGRTTTWTDPHGRPYTGPPPLADPPDPHDDLRLLQFL
ncbi:MAG TPA: DUF222 domain-containing protein [Mycobacteriales bacterium]